MPMFIDSKRKFFFFTLLALLTKAQHSITENAHIFCLVSNDGHMNYLRLDCFITLLFIFVFDNSSRHVIQLSKSINWVIELIAGQKKGQELISKLFYDLFMKNICWIQRRIFCCGLCWIGIPQLFGGMLQ